MYKIMRRIDPNGTEFEALPGTYETPAQVVTRLTDHALKAADYGRTMYVVAPDGERLSTSDFVWRHDHRMPAVPR